MFECAHANRAHLVCCLHKYIMPSTCRFVSASICCSVHVSRHAERKVEMCIHILEVCRAVYVLFILMVMFTSGSVWVTMSVLSS